MNYYQWYKQHGICPRCKKVSSAPGRVLCEDCLKSERKRQRATAEQVEYYREYLLKWRKSKIEAGICIGCKNPAIPGRRRCEACTQKIREYERQRKRRKAEREAANNG